MALIRIISGTYGYRPGDGQFVVAVHAGEGPISVSDEEAERLIGLGVAAPEAETTAEAVATAAPAPEGSGATYDSPAEEGGERDAPGAVSDTLDDMTVEQLKKLAQELGIDTAGLRKKADLIEAVKAADGPAPSMEPEDVVEE